ncbi:hypothetical protein M409DRAFT_70874 [Zasmidium cellare ATCC 36951]|uniref:Uncharacterized protein n=1 Tax=Zasmidium cellare ATCC 36951 TaxID=1080233 RepID=A0A6A6BY23_ZASCE|nr:uncharacterized protein M409DRAFT_70874 [Zasmidium cellare ATCC 36951]KAF2159697.1 hypothetical protein M409DRAFT_70874 [Zasmidium cellare ATCC 36951]
MFSKRRGPPKRSSDHAASPNAVPSPVSASSTTAHDPPLVSPLQMAFDFESFDVPPPLSASTTDAPPSPFSPASAESPARPRTSHGLPGSSSNGIGGKNGSGRGNNGLQPPSLPPIPQVASRNNSTRSSNSNESREQEHASHWAKARARDEADNASVVSKKSALKARLSFEHPIDMLPPLSRPSTPGGSKIPERPQTAAGSSNASTPRMESSLFPTRNDVPILPQPPNQPAMSRSFIDSRDKPYSQPRPRPFMMQGNHSSPSLLQPQAASANGRQPTPIYGSSKNFISPKPSIQNMSQRTNLSGSTARPSTQASSLTANSNSPTVTIGTPYQATANTFPLPQHVMTRPKTPGATATVAGVSVPTHHTSSKSIAHPPEQKEPKKKGRLLNPLSLLQRRRSNQDPDVVTEERSQRQAQAQALARQRDVAQSGIYKPPPDFDPRIKGKLVHDFSAPRSSKRNTFDELSMSDDMQSPEQPLPSPGYPPRNASLVNRGPLSDRSERRSTHTPVFMEHLGENPEASRRISSLQAENLENKDFLQRASKHSSITSYSQESAILPPFARRSQVLDATQASFYKDDESKRSSDPSSEKERDSTLSSISEVSPITARSSAHNVDVRQSLSPVSPSSPSKGYRPVSDVQGPSSVRPVSEASSKSDSQDSGKRPVSQLTKTSSQERRSKGASEVTARPYSVVLAPPVINTIAEGSVESSPIDGASTHSPQILTRGISIRHSANSGPEPDALQPPGAHTPGKADDSSASPSLLERTAGIPTPEKTPEPELVESIQFKPNKDSPKLVEKRTSAVGHSRKSSNVPKHHASNASRFSFQPGSESALQEQALEEKHRALRKSQMTEMIPRGPTPDDEDDDDDFDADAMDDMDEMEMEAEKFGEPVKPMEPMPPSQSGLYLQQARQALQQDSYSDDESVYDDDIPEVTNEEDVPYPDHPAFRTHSALGSYSQRNSYQMGTPDGYWRGSTIDHYMRDSYFMPTHSRMHSQNSDATGDTSSTPRSNFYLQPSTAVDTPTASPHSEKRLVPPRDSGNSEQNRVASGMTVIQPGSASSSEESLLLNQGIENPDREHVISGMSYSTVNTDDAQSPQKNIATNPLYRQSQAAKSSTHVEDSPPFRNRDSGVSESTRVPSAMSLSTSDTTDQRQRRSSPDVEKDRGRTETLDEDEDAISLASPAKHEATKPAGSTDDDDPDVLSLASPNRSTYSPLGVERTLSHDEISLASPPRNVLGHGHSDSIDAISLASPTKNLGQQDYERNNSAAGISLASPTHELEQDEEHPRKQSKASIYSDGRRNGSVGALSLGSPPQSRFGHRSTESGMSFEDFAQSGLSSPSAPEHRALRPVTPPATSHGDPNATLSPSSKASSPRTVSTGLGLSMFAGFDFDEQPPLPTTQITSSEDLAKDSARPVAGIAQTPASPQQSQSSNPRALGSPSSTASSPRTVSTAMGMSMFGGFEFEDRAGPLPDLPSKSKHNKTASAASGISPRNSAFAHAKSASVQQQATTTQPDHQRFLSLSTAGQNDRTVSTALGMSSFGGFDFDDGPSSLYSSQRDTSSTQQSTFGKALHKPNESQSAPRGDWSDLQKHTSPTLGSPSRVTVPTYHVSGESQDTNLPQDQDSGPASARTSMNPNFQYARPSIAYAEDDDMYFDDGNFEHDINGSHGASFDENVFDDDAFVSRPGFVNRYQHQRDNSGMTMTSLGSDGPYPSFAMPNAARASARYSQMGLEDLPLHDQFDPRFIPQRNPSEDAKRLGMSDRVPPVPVPESNTEAFSRMQQSLHSYHAALADAATKAAADGRFVRAPSISVSTTQNLAVEPKTLMLPDDRSIKDDKSVYSNGEEGGEIAMPHNDANSDSNGHLGRSDTNVSHLTHLTNYSPPKMSFDFGFDQPEHDDDLYDGFGNDDDLVAAANAEALALDEDGFYGQEFDFYRRPRANSGDLESVNGGYFGEDGDDGLTRNKSLKEPNLTPITERSEFSTRNSFIGFGANGQFGPASAGPYGPHSPALARMPVTPLIESEVTSFDELRRLKANAFAGGGSQSGSLKSNSNRSSSQSLQNTFSPAQGTRPGQGYFGGVPMQFAYSNDSSGSSNPNSGHPITIGGQHGFNFQDSPQSAGSSQGMPFSVDPDATPKRNNHSQQQQQDPPTARKVPPTQRDSNASVMQGHSRKGSGADSVTYVREPNPEGSGKPRWVLERRRTSEQGQLELIGRELVQSGWI